MVESGGNRRLRAFILPLSQLSYAIAGDRIRTGDLQVL